MAISVSSLVVLSGVTIAALVLAGIVGVVFMMIRRAIEDDEAIL